MDGLLEVDVYGRNTGEGELGGDATLLLEIEKGLKFVYPSALIVNPYVLYVQVV